jgi:hypothetical protein
VENKTRFGRKDIIFTTLASIAYLLLSALLVGFKTDQVWLIAIFNGCFYASWISRRFIIGFSIFIVYWIVFDYMKAFPNYMFFKVHIADIYEFEKHLFGIREGGKVLTPNEYWLIHAKVWMDVISGVFYLCWVPVPLMFAVYLFFKDRLALLHFAATFFFVNLLGFVVYYTFPAAPPWYVQLHGFEFIQGTPGNTAGLARFDAYFHVHIFHSIYSKGSNVFAAMPSLHSAYPLIVLYYSRYNASRFFQFIFAIVSAGIWCAAVYLSHHYVVDVIAGITCALLGIFLYRRWLMRIPAYDRGIQWLYSFVRG